MDDDEGPILAFDGDDLEWSPVIVVTEEVETWLTLPARSVLDTDPCVLDGEASPRARDTVPGRRPGPSDSFVVPIILSDNTKLTTVALKGLHEERDRIFLFVGNPTDEHVCTGRGVEVEVAPGPGVLVGLNHRAVREFDLEHPHELGNLVRGKLRQRLPVGLEALPHMPAKPPIPLSRHATKPRQEMRTGQDVSGPAL